MTGPDRKTGGKLANSTLSLNISRKIKIHVFQNSKKTFFLSRYNLHGFGFSGNNNFEISRSIKEGSEYPVFRDMGHEMWRNTEQPPFYGPHVTRDKSKAQNSAWGVKQVRGRA